MNDSDHSEPEQQYLKTRIAREVANALLAYATQVDKCRDTGLMDADTHAEAYKAHIEPLRSARIAFNSLVDADGPSTYQQH
jgi:hypothetical protein